jgi:hypothetical protein
MDCLECQHHKLTPWQCTTLAHATTQQLLQHEVPAIVTGFTAFTLQGVAIDKTLTRPGDWVATGVTTDADVRPGARIMVASVLLYGFVQVL